MSEQFEQRGPFKKRGQFKKSLLKVGTLAGALVILGHFAATHAHRFLDVYWLEEAHQAYLTTLVAARNDAWENHRTVFVCAANSQQNCIDIRNGLASGERADVNAGVDADVGLGVEKNVNTDATQVTSWLAYSLSPSHQKIIIAEHPFHSQYIAFNYRPSLATSTLTIGFDADGYSLQPQVFAFELTTLAQLSHKNYHVIVEPSGAVQSLAGRHKAQRAVAQHFVNNNVVGDVVGHVAGDAVGDVVSKEPVEG